MPIGPFSRLTWILTVLAGMGLALPAGAQVGPPVVREAGHYLVQNFGPEVYGQHNGNWAIAQDSSGVLYVGNTNGVMTYDGVRWTLIPITSLGTVRSLALGQNDRVFVGGYGEVGYLEADSVGTLTYRSLVDQLPDDDRTFTDVWQAFAIGDAVYFMAPQQLMRWGGTGPMQVWPAGPGFHVSFVVRDTLFVRQREVGLLQLVDDELRLLPGGALFRDDPVFVLLPFGPDGMLAISRQGGAFRYRDAGFEPYPTDADAFLREHSVYHGARLHDGTFALGTERGGVILLEPNGQIRAILNEATGVRDETVWFVHPDWSGGLWMALNDGLARAEAPGPMTVFGRSSGLEGGAWDVLRHEGRLYAANDVGVFVLEPGDAAGKPARFVPVPGIRAACWALLSTDAGLLAGCQDQTFVLSERGVQRVFSDGTTYRLHRSGRQPNRIYAGLHDGLVVYEAVDGSIVSRGRLPGIEEKIYSIQEDNSGALWLGTSNRGVIRVRSYEDSTQPPEIDRYGPEHGLPEGWANVYRIGNQIVVGTEAETFRFEEGRGFVSDPVLGETKGVFVASEAASGDVWVYAAPDILRFVSGESGALRQEETPLRRLRPSQANVIYSEQDGVVWIGRNDGLVRYDTSEEVPPQPTFRALIHRVSGLQDGATIHGGASVAAAASTLPFERNALRFEYAAPTFDDVEATRYQYRLDGLDADWSAWTNETYRDYTRLAEGPYVFHVRARNAYGQISEPGTVAFAILPPWYRTWWAWGLYGMMAIVGVVGLVGWRSNRLEVQKRRLQQVVRERTLEIEQQRQQLVEQARRLKEHDELKSRFFANVSHEFRTPLTLTIGPLDDLRSGYFGVLDEAVVEQVDLALRNARRLLLLINQLLDIARIESGRMELDRKAADLVPFAADVAAAFAPLAERNGITLKVDVPNHPLIVAFDGDQMEKVLGNLLSNAFKFTPAGGTIQVSLELDESEAGFARIRVRDTGRGINPEALPRVFDRFYGGEEGFGHTAGTGIGLSLVRELVELHEGTIDAESEPGKGATFTVLLPALGGRESVSSARVTGAVGPVVGPAPDEAARPAKSGVFDANVIDAHPVARDAGRNGGAGMDAEDPRLDVTTIMIVDDNAEIRAYVRRHLSPAYRVVDFGDAESALEAMPEALPDLVVCDVMMPGMDGYAFCSAVKNDPAFDFVPVILLTARAEKSDRIGGWSEGADDYVTKPFDMAELEARVQNLIASRRRLRDRLRASRVIPVTTRAVESADDRYLDRVRQIVEEHLDDDEFTVDALADAMGQSRVQLYRRLQALVDKSPSVVIREIRLAHAAQLLAGRAGTVSEIAYAAGFKSVSHFCRCFREHFGRTPSDVMGGADDDPG